MHHVKTNQGSKDWGAEHGDRYEKASQNAVNTGCMFDPTSISEGHVMQPKAEVRARFNKAAMHDWATFKDSFLPYSSYT